MGTNKRYAESIEMRAVMRGVPLTLREELELDEYPETRTRKPVDVWAWVRYPEGAVKVAAEMVAWTERAAAVRWKTPIDEEHRAWVWISAVTPRGPGIPGRAQLAR